MGEQGRFAGCRRALEGGGRHPDDDVAASEISYGVRAPDGAGDGIELVAALDQSRRRLGMYVGPERHDKHVGLEVTLQGADGAVGGVDRQDAGAEEGQTRPLEVLVPVECVRRGDPAEHDVQLREPEHEAVGAIDQDDVHLPGRLLAERRRDLQTAEASAEDDDAAAMSCGHGASPLIVSGSATSAFSRTAATSHRPRAEPFITRTLDMCPLTSRRSLAARVEPHHPPSLSCARSSGGSCSGSGSEDDLRTRTARVSK